MKKIVWAHLFSTVFVSPALLSFMSPAGTTPAEVSDIQAQPPAEKPAPSLVKQVPSAEKAVAPNQVIDQPIDLYPQFGGVELKQGAVFFVTGEFLYWAVIKDIQGSSLKNLSADKSHRKENFYKFDYRPGFRVGIGMTLPNFDEWVTAVEYTRYHHDFTTRDSAQPPATLSPQTINTTQFLSFKEIQSELKIRFDEWKGKVGRPFYFGQKLIADAFFGVKGIWVGTALNQNLVSNSTPTLNRVQRGNFHVWSVGTMAGLNGHVILFDGLSVFAKAEIGFLYGRINRKTQEVRDPMGPIAKQSYPHAPYLFFPAAEGGIGLQWGHYLFDQRARFSVGATYDFNSLYITASSADTILITGSPFFHGLTINGRFDF